MSSPKATLEMLPKGVQALLALGAIALAAFPLIPSDSSDFYLQMLSQMMILAIFAMSLDLLQGVTGLVSLGHAAYFGLAGYALAFLTPTDTPISLWWSLPLAAAGAGLAARSECPRASGTYEVDPCRDQPGTAHGPDGRADQSPGRGIAGLPRWLPDDGGADGGWSDDEG